MIYLEALVMAVVATALGIVGGVLVAKVLLALFNAAGAGFPDAATVLHAPHDHHGDLRRRRHHDAVGDRAGPAGGPDPAGRRDASGARLRGDQRRGGSSSARSSPSSAPSLFLLGLFLRPGGTLGMIALVGGGALLIFLGVGQRLVDGRPAGDQAIGWPVAKVLGTPGVLARENAGRAPRRTSATAAALMIGVALVSAAAVFASSLRSTFAAVLEGAVQADYIVTDESFQGLPPVVAESLRRGPRAVRR